MAVDLTPENEEIFRRYLLLSRCGLKEYAEGIEPYLLAVVAEAEANANKFLMENSARSALAEVF